ncbi:beta-galactosidase, partial [Bacteroidota bacterium]
MKSVFKILIAFSILCLNCSGPSQTLEEKARKKIAALEKLVQVAEDKGIETDRERMTIRTSEIFLDYANWDEANTAKNQKYFEMQPMFEPDAENLAVKLPDFERTEVIKILDDAIARIDLIIKGKYKRKSAPSLDWSNIEISGNTLMQDGRPVFLADHVWRPDLPELEEFYGALDGNSLSPRLVVNEKGDINPETVERLKNKTGENLGSVFIDNNGFPKWVWDKYENFGTGGGIFGKYDIDHPGAREIYGNLYKGTVPYLAGKRSTELGYMLFNEPSFFTSTGVWNTRAVSEFTKDKFRVWLKGQHTSINELNILWGSNFKSFDDVRITIPIETSLQGTPMWYDWMDFNNYRVTEWFTFVKGEIRKYDPEARVHIKL